MKHYCTVALLTLLATYTKAQEIDWLVYPAAHEEYSSGSKGAALFANAHEVNLTPSNCGEYETYATGKMRWRVGLTSASAVSMNIIVENVALQPDEKIMIYSPSADEEKRQVVTMTNMRPDGILQSDIVEGDSIIMEFEGSLDREPDFVITTVNCGFRPILRQSQPTAGGNKVGFGQSDNCHVDASCDEQYKDINQSTCMLVVNGKAYGSGVFVNNTANDATPYVITAAHVLTSAGSTVKSCNAYLNYYTPLCTESYQNLDGEQLGSSVEVVVMSEIHDMALLKFSSSPKDDSRVFWSGWDLGSSHEGMVHCIHYPYGDARKASVGKSVKKASYTLDKTNSGESFATDNHWNVGQWISGTTQAGSSGSGLFNQDLKLIGSLSGGSATCNSPYNDFFWRLESSWDVEYNGKTLRSVLDPLNTGATTCEGYYYYNTYHYDLFFNLDVGDPIVCERPKDGKGYVAGHNNVRTTAVAEQFGETSSEMLVQGVYIVPRKVTTTNSQTFNLKIWSDKNGNPGDVLYEYNDLTISTLTKNRQCYLKLSEPLDIAGKFYIGVELNYNDVFTDTLALYHTTNNEHNGARFKNNGVWEDYSDLIGEEGATCDIFIGFKGVKKTMTDSVVVHKEKNKTEVKDNKIYISGKGVRRVRFYDMTGHRTAEKAADVNSTMTIIDLADMPDGISIVEIETEQGVETLKLLR